MTSTDSTPRPLDGYEQALLTELRTVVAARHGGDHPPTDNSSRPNGRLRRGAVLVAAATIAALAGAAVLTSPTPAFAVESRGGDEVTLTINRPENPAAIEAALSEHGIDAVVDFTPAGYLCAPERFVPAPAPTNAAGEDHEILLDQQRDGSRPFSLTIDPDAFHGYTLIIETGWSDDTLHDVAVHLTEGPVAACTLTPSATPPGDVSTSPTARPTR